jgi:hypothetical protein
MQARSLNAPLNRRTATQVIAVGGVLAPMLPKLAQAKGAHATSVPHPGNYAPGRPGVDYQPTDIPNGYKLPFIVRDGVKIFEIVIDEFDHEFMPGLTARVWGFNGAGAGAAIEAVEGDKVRIYVFCHRVWTALVDFPNLIFHPARRGSMSFRSCNMARRCFMPIMMKWHKWVWV